MRFSFFLFSFFLLSCNQKPQGSSSQLSDSVPSGSPVAMNTDSDNQISCWGIGEIELSDDFEGIREKVGDKNISRDSLFLEGMFESLITTVWKGTDKEITVRWEEKQGPFKTIRYLEISHPESPYSFANGIKIGTTLKEIERLNGNNPVHLYGFGWDYGGTFIDFGTGKLKGDLPCFGGVFQLKGESVNKDISEVMGDQKISSDNPAVQNREVRLSVIRIGNVK